MTFLARDTCKISVACHLPSTAYSIAQTTFFFFATVTIQVCQKHNEDMMLYWSSNSNSEKTNTVYRYSKKNKISWGWSVINRWIINHMCSWNLHTCPVVNIVKQVCHVVLIKWLTSHFELHFGNLWCHYSGQEMYNVRCERQWSWMDIHSSDKWHWHMWKGFDYHRVTILT